MDFLSTGKFSLFLGSVILLTAGHARAVAVYQSPEALFSTANLHPRVLKPDNKMVLKSWVHTEQGYLSRGSVMDDLDLSTSAVLNQETPLRSKPNVEISGQTTLDAHTKVEILERRENWVKVKTETSHGWVLEENLSADPFDRGLVFTKKAISSLIAPNAKSKTAGIIPRELKLKPLAFHNSWVLVKYQDVAGWVHFDDLFSKLDFALRIKPRDEKQGWRLVMAGKASGHKYQPVGPWFRVGVHEWLGLNQIKALQTDPRKFIVVSHEIQGRELPSQARLRLLGTYHFGDTIKLGLLTTVTWMHMNSPEGSVWWPLYPAGAGEKNQVSASVLTNAQIFSRKIYDLAESPKTAHLKLVSCRGIYKTIDEKIWRKISFFGAKNFPVAFSPNGDIFVGGYRSHDQGLTFAPFLRWDRVLSRISQKQNYAAQNLRLTKIEFKNGKPDIYITVNGARDQGDFILSSQDGGLHWNDVPEKKSLRPDFSHSLSMNAD